MEVDCLSQGTLLLEWYLLPHIAKAAFQLWGLPEAGLLGSSHFTQCQQYYTWKKPLPLGGIGGECIQPSLDISDKLCLSFFLISSSGSVPVSGRTCLMSIQTSDSSGTMLDVGTMVSPSFQHVGRHSSMLSCHKRSHCGCFGRPDIQSSAISAFNPLAAQRYVLHRKVFFPSVCQVMVGAT